MTTPTLLRTPEGVVHEIALTRSLLEQVRASTSVDTAAHVELLDQILASSAATGDMSSVPTQRLHRVFQQINRDLANHLTTHAQRYLDAVESGIERAYEIACPVEEAGIEPRPGQGRYKALGVLTAACLTAVVFVSRALR